MSLERINALDLGIGRHLWVELHQERWVDTRAPVERDKHMPGSEQVGDRDYYKSEADPDLDGGFDSML